MPNAYVTRFPYCDMTIPECAHSQSLLVPRSVAMSKTPSFAQSSLPINTYVSCHGNLGAGRRCHMCFSFVTAETSK